MMYPVHCHLKNVFLTGCIQHHTNSLFYISINYLILILIIVMQNILFTFTFTFKFVIMFSWGGGTNSNLGGATFGSSFTMLARSEVHFGLAIY